MMSSRVTSTRNNSRRGLTLLEVLLATALLGMALTALAQLQSAGVRAALGAQLEAEAALICQTEMDSLVCGAIDSQDSALGDLRSIAPIVSAPGWSRRIVIETTPTPDLQSITVEIYRSNALHGNPLARLTRWMASASTAGGRP